MDLNKMISGCKKLINLPYNQLNLDNYKSIIEKMYDNIPILYIQNTNNNAPIKLMSGNHNNAGIINTLPDETYKENIYLIGKGVLFDAGGYDLKPRGKFNDMKTDMAGMAIAIGVSAYLKKNVIAVCPVATNFLHNNQITPGDVIPIGRKKVEVTNTDAEGRLIIAETLSLIKQQQKDIIITIATLTGCVGYAIDSKATGVFTDSNYLWEEFQSAAQEAKEPCWRLPMWDYLQKKHYNKTLIKNSINEIKAGATEGAMFIKQFVEYPKNWIHFDCAYSAFSKNNKANGVPIRSLIKFINKIK